MSFPPVFDHTWDITQPPDTQPANLLGQDLRNLKDDIMQRMSLISGLDANKPTPEVVNAAWGGTGFGILFFATDTGIIYQWSGAAWVDVTADFIVPNAVALATTGTPVNVALAAPPTAGQILTATDATHATWQDNNQIVSVNFLLNISGPVGIQMWRAPFSCTALQVSASIGGTGPCTVNAQTAGGPLLAGDLNVTSAGLVTTPATQNQAMAAGDILSVFVHTLSAPPADVMIQVDLQRT